MTPSRRHAPCAALAAALEIESAARDVAKENPRGPCSPTSRGDRSPRWADVGRGQSGAVFKAPCFHMANGRERVCVAAGQGLLGVVF